jgi:hypothetical protein
MHWVHAEYWHEGHVTSLRRAFVKGDTHIWQSGMAAEADIGDARMMRE